jgi:hypothetical protein
MGKYSTHRGNMWVVGTRLRYHIVEEGGSREEGGRKGRKFSVT